MPDDLFRVDIVSYEVRPGDSYVLTSDGVHGQVSVEKMTAHVATAGSAADIADALVKSADDAGGLDNATAIVLRF